MAENTELPRWSSRKFWSAMCWQAVFTVLVYTKAIPANVYEGLTWVTLGGFFLASVAEKKLSR